MIQSKIEIKKKFPRFESFNGPCLLIYDIYFDKNKLLALKPVQEWIATFPYKIGFTSGEELKDLQRFPEKLEKILKLISAMAVKDVQIVGLGGGSIGDFTGFVASILKRGLPLIHIPTTWLSAMDSSHGGKTALNVAGFKNQIGTFYPAKKIYLIKPILFQQPKVRAEEAFGEALKMALLTGGKTWQQFSKIKKFDNNLAWRFLPQLIAGKYRIVNKDPFEKKGVRQLLNLGHTLGHVWESALGLPHGIAVAYGIRAAIEYSFEEEIMSNKIYQQLQQTAVIALLPSKDLLIKLIQNTAIKATLLAVKEALLKDKKISNKNTVRFIFIQKPGTCPIKDVKVDKIIKFCSNLQSQKSL